MNIQIAQKGIILNKENDSILAIKYLESKFLPKTLIGKLGLPGGKIKPGEDPDKSFIREVFEETGINILPGNPIKTYSWIYEKDKRPTQIVSLVRMGKYKSGKPQASTNEHEVVLAKARWIDLKDIKISDFISDNQPIIKYFLEIKDHLVSLENY